MQSFPSDAQVAESTFLSTAFQAARSSVRRSDYGAYMSRILSHDYPSVAVEAVTSTQPDSTDGLFSPALRRLAQDVLAHLREHPLSWLAGDVERLKGTLSLQDEPVLHATWDDILTTDLRMIAACLWDSIHTHGYYGSGLESLATYIDVRLYARRINHACAQLEAYGQARTATHYRVLEDGVPYSLSYLRERAEELEDWVSDLKAEELQEAGEGEYRAAVLGEEA